MIFFKHVQLYKNYSDIGIFTFQTLFVSHNKYNHTTLHNLNEFYKILSPCRPKPIGRVGSLVKSGQIEMRHKNPTVALEVSQKSSPLSIIVKVLYYHYHNILNLINRNIDHVVKNADHLEDTVAMLRQVGGRHGSNYHDVASSFFPVVITYNNIKKNYDFDF